MKNFRTNFILIALVLLIPLFISTNVNAQTYNLDAIADLNTSIPDGTGNFTSFGDPVSLGGGDLAFVGSGSTGQIGIYESESGVLSTVADINTAIPDGTGNFTSFGDPVSLGGGDLVFVGSGSTGQIGIYQVISGVLSRVADINTAIPDGTGGFTDFGDLISLESDPVSSPDPVQVGNLAFIGLGSTGQVGIYEFKDGVLSTAADLNSAVPDGTGNFADFQDIFSIGQGNLAFVGLNGSSQQGIYAFKFDSLSMIVNENTPVPFNEGTIDPGTFDNYNTPISIGGEDITFRGEAGAHSGMYTIIGGVLAIVADIDTTVPMGAGTFDDISGDPRSSGGADLVFSATNASNVELFGYIDNQLLKIAANDTLVPMGTDPIGTLQGYISLPDGGAAFIASGISTGMYAYQHGGLLIIVDSNTSIPMGAGNFTGFDNPVSLGGEDVAFRGLGSGEEGIYKASKIIETSSITIIKQTVPEGITGFSFVGTGFPEGCELSAFTTGDSDFVSCELDAGTYTVQETPIPDGFTLADIDCIGSSSFTETADSVTVNLVEGENVVCTFTNTLDTVFTLEPLTPSHVGVRNTFKASGATPNGDVTFIFGFVEQVVTADNICLGLQAGILNPRVITTVVADESGMASFSLIIPTDFAGIDVVLQAIDITTCTGSNVNPESLIDPPLIGVFNLLPLNPGTAGVQNTFTATGATLSGLVTFTYGFVEQVNTADSICPGFQSRILNPRIITTILSDDSDLTKASFSLIIPANFAGVSVLVQAVDLATCTGSNVNAETL